RAAGIGLAPDAEAPAVVGGGPPRLVLRDVPDDAVVGLDGALEPSVHLGLGPVLHAQVLEPLIVADGHAPGIADDVGDHVDLAALEHAIGLGSGRAVGALGHHL